MFGLYRSSFSTKETSRGSARCRLSGRSGSIECAKIIFNIPYKVNFGDEMVLVGKKEEKCWERRRKSKTSITQTNIKHSVAPSFMYIMQRLYWMWAMGAKEGSDWRMNAAISFLSTHNSILFLLSLLPRFFLSSLFSLLPSSPPSFRQYKHTWSLGSNPWRAHDLDRRPYLEGGAGGGVGGSGGAGVQVLCQAAQRRGKKGGERRERREKGGGKSRKEEERLERRGKKAGR